MLVLKSLTITSHNKEGSMMTRGEATEPPLVLPSSESDVYTSENYIRTSKICDHENFEAWKYCLQPTDSCRVMRGRWCGHLWKHRLPVQQFFWACAMELSNATDTLDFGRELCWVNYCALCMYRFIIVKQNSKNYLKPSLELFSAPLKRSKIECIIFCKTSTLNPWAFHCGFDGCRDGK